jgi:UDP-N-acetylglucosamine 4,6-dehydratase/5-epimerase
MSRILIFGGTGSLGRKLIERWSPKHQVTVYSRDEAKHWSLRQDFAGLPDINPPQFMVGDIRDPHRVRDVIDRVNPHTVIIAAALKQVDTCELSPSESVATNLIGTQNVINAVYDHNCVREVIDSVLFVSTDKACSPVNVYGMCKATSERIVTSQAAHARYTKFLCTRYGNVLESRGSIIPLFRYQAENAPALTVTDPEMTRYMMTLDQSVDLIDIALERGASGETWVPRLPAMKIGKLAAIFSRRYDKPIKFIGLRPGEKLHEDLINESESVRTREEGVAHYVIGPAHVAGVGPRFTYTSSSDVLTGQELEIELVRLGIFEKPLSAFKGLNIEEIVTKRNT